MAKLLQAETGNPSYWAGFSDRALDGYGTTSFGDNKTLSTTDFITSHSFGCGLAGSFKGFLTTAACKDEYNYVCSRKPDYAQPDYHCPKEFYPYRGQCIHPDFQTVNYDDAAVECAKRGSILVPIKDIEMHQFIMNWASTLLGSDTWIGLRRKRWIQIYEESASSYHPLEEEIQLELTHTDGEPFDPETDYNFGIKKWRGTGDECFFFKQTDKYELQGTLCSKEKSFFCLWQEHECPDDYHYIGQVSDGRTCHSFSESAAVFEEASCDANGDFLRHRWTPQTPYEIDRLRRRFLDDSERVWTSAQVDIEGIWNLVNNEDDTEEMFTELYSDMRRLPRTTSWVPDSEMVVESLNQTGFGCLEITSNGLFNPLFNDCEEEASPTCEYTGIFKIQHCFFSQFLFHFET